MARSVYSNPLRNRTNRLKLTPRKKPFKCLVSPGVHLAYRRNATTSGTWSVLTDGMLRRFALADDFEDSNGKAVMTFFEAQQAALKLARGTEDTGKPVTVAGALDAYQTNLESRKRSIYNASIVRKHLPTSLASKLVMSLTESDLSEWRDKLVVDDELKLLIIQTCKARPKAFSPTLSPWSHNAPTKTE